MSSAFNKVIFMGNLTHDPELKTTESGLPVCSFDIAVNEPGRTQSDPFFIRIVTFRKQAENCARYLSRGRPVFVEGRMQARQWEDQEGNRRKSSEVIARLVKFLGRPKEQETLDSI